MRDWGRLLRYVLYTPCGECLESPTICVQRHTRLLVDDNNDPEHSRTTFSNFFFYYFFFMYFFIVHIRLGLDLDSAETSRGGSRRPHSQNTDNII